MISFEVGDLRNLIEQCKQKALSVLIALVMPFWMIIFQMQNSLTYNYVLVVLFASLRKYTAPPPPTAPSFIIPSGWVELHCTACRKRSCRSEQTAFLKTIYNLYNYKNIDITQPLLNHAALSLCSTPPVVFQALTIATRCNTLPPSCNSLPPCCNSLPPVISI